MTKAYDALSKYILEKLDEAIKVTLDASPWWCPMCSEGGNYEGPRPDDWLLPPEGHICPPIKTNLKGLFNG